MKPGISLEQARSELHVLDQRYAAAHPERPDSGPLGISTLQGQITARVRTLLWMLLGAVGFVLLIACANVANLLTARATSRTGEFAIRTALGAAPGRLVRQLLTESVVLATAGGALGLFGAAFGLRALLAMPGLELPRAEEVRVDAAVLGFTIAISIGTGLLFGVLPAWQAIRPSRMGLRRGPSGPPILTRRGGPSGPPESSVSRSRFGIPSRSLLVVGQVAVSIVLVVGAALLVKSLIRLAAVDPGFQHAGLLTMRVPLPLDQYDTPARRAAFFDALVQRVEEVPGVTGAAVSRTLPTTLGTLATNVQIVGQLIPEPGHLGMAFQAVTPGYFSVLGIPLKRGREFTDRDNVTGARPVAIINERFARRFWPEYPQGEDPVGQQLGVPYLRAGRLEIVGIAGDVLERGLTVESEPQFYVPNVLSPPTTAYVSIRTDGDPLRVVGGIRAAARQIDDGRAVADLRMLDERFGSSVGQRYAAAQLLGTFAGVALLLAMVGVYSVVAHSVVRRAQEIGIRRALGAQPHAILALVVGDGMRLTLAGVACGLAGAFVLTRVMTSLLFEVSPTDPATFAGVATLFVLVAGLAALLPAWRAARIDPAAILRT
jgi:predicted permease